MSTLASRLAVVRYYTEFDPIFYTVDNRPLSDLAANSVTIANTLDQRTYAIDVAGSSTPTVVHAPDGWIVTRNGAGDYTVTHNLGNTGAYIVTGSVYATTPGVVIFMPYSITGNSFSFTTTNLAAANVDARAMITMNVY